MTAVERREASAPLYKRAAVLLWARHSNTKRLAALRLPFWEATELAWRLGNTQNSDARASRERDRFFILPRENGGGGPRSCAVEGASDSSVRFRRRRIVDARAPSTILRLLRKLQMVPLPRYRGAGCRYVAV